MIETLDDVKLEIQRRWNGRLKEVQLRQDIQPIYSWYKQEPLFVRGMSHCVLTWIDSSGLEHQEFGEDVRSIFIRDEAYRVYCEDSAEHRWLHDQGF